MSELRLIKCRCPLDKGAPPPVPPCPVPHDRWLKQLPTVSPLNEPFPCLCSTRGCSPIWCPCAGRVDLEAVPASCCAHRHTPRVVAAANHGGDYRPCWCRGDIDRHQTEISPAALGSIIPALPEDEEEDS